MWKWAIGLAAAVAASGCAAHRAPALVAPASGTTEWRAVGALTRGTAVDVTLGDGSVRRGLVLAVTGETLRLRAMAGDGDLRRDDVARLTPRIQTGMTRDLGYGDAHPPMPTYESRLLSLRQ